MATKKPKESKEVSKTSLTELPDGQSKDSGPAPDSEEMKQLFKQREFLQGAKTAFQAAADGRRRYDAEWLGRNLFWRGYQFSRYQPATQTVVLAVRQSARVPVNLTAAYMRSIRNQITSFRPKFEVLPTTPNSESAKVQARYAQRLLDYYFDHLGLKMKIKETITQALMYSIGGPWQIVYDSLKKEVKIWLLDPFDFYMDPLTEDPNDASYMIKAVRRPLGEVVTNPDFSVQARREITGPDAKIAASEYKQFLIQATRIVPTKSESNPTIILFEGYFKKHRPTGEVYMVKCIWTETSLTPLVYEEIDTDEYDFVVYRGDLNPKEPYGESWIKHVMPINRVLNTLESSTLEYNTRVAKGRIVVDRDSGVRSIHNIHGEIVSKNRGSTVEAMDMPGLPVAVPQQIERMQMYGEDIGGVHSATLGRMPPGIRSGIGIAELKQADSASQDDYVDNLEDFLSDVAFKILKKIAQNYSSYKVIKDLGVREGDEKYFAVIGKKFAKKKSGDELGHPGQVKIGPDWLDVAEIADDNNIRVSVGSWLGFTKEALQQKVLTYYQAGIIDQATALKLLEFGDVDSIIQQTRIESLLKKNLNTQGQPGQIDPMQLASAENDMMLEGKLPPAEDSDDHQVHIAIHQEALGRGMDQVVGEHIEQHQAYMGRNMAIPSANGLDLRDQMRQPAQPAGMPNEPAPNGPPSGQQLPQQDIQQGLANNAEDAAAAIMGGGAPS